MKKKPGAVSNERAEIDSVPIRLLLQSNYRNGDGVSRVEAIAERLGMDVASSGKTSVNCNVPPSVFQKLFGSKLTKIEAKPSGPSDFGTPSGLRSEDPIPVPADLVEFVELISIEPPATRMSGSPKV